MRPRPDGEDDRSARAQHDDEWRALGRLAGSGLRSVVDMTRDTHAAITTRVSRALPETARPVVAAERAVASGVYAAVAASLRRAALAAAHVAATSAAPDSPAPSQTAAGRALLPAVNGLWGDHIQVEHDSLAVRMSIRVDGQDVPVTASGLASAYPSATPDLVVLVHGLGEHDESWDRGRPGASGGYGGRLRDDLGLTPVTLRYNTGLRVSENGQLLSDLLDELVAAWPVTVASLSIVGHSMGGLVARSAAHHGHVDGSAWVALLHAVVTLGTPHLGAPLEKTAHVAEWLLRRWPESHALSRPLAARSSGIRDLRFGALVEEHWAPEDERLLHDRTTDVPTPAHASLYWVGSTLTRDPDHPVGHALGDGLVRRPSAEGRARATDGVVLGGADHLSLLDHPTVYQHLVRWLDPTRRERPAPPMDAPL